MMIGSGPCRVCGHIFIFDPDRVPSFRGEPVCRDCMMAVNQRRQDKGLEPFRILSGAYDVQEDDRS